MRILIVEDEPKLSALLEKGLKAENYQVDIAHDGEEGCELAMINDYAVILLDYLLPKKNGIEVIKYLRSEECHSKILMLTAKDAIDDKIQGLNAGADDYMVKPFSFEELLARIRVLLRRGGNEKESVLIVNDLSLNLLNHEVKRANQLISLSSREFALLEYFMRHPDQVISRTTLSDHVWDSNSDNFSNVIDVYVSYLRNKIDKGFSRSLIYTLRGKGYILKTQ